MTRIHLLAPIATGIVGFYSGLTWMKSYSINDIRVSAASDVVSIDNSPSSEVKNTVTQHFILQHGMPSHDSIIVKRSFVLSYDRRNKVPYWVMEHLTPSLISKGEDADRAKCDFYEDDTVHLHFRATLEDYRGSGYDRGHLAASSNHRWSLDLMGDTYALSNIAPQVGKGFNQGAWLKLEKHVQSLVKQYKSVFVCSGPLYLPRVENDGKKYVVYQVIGENNVSVPTHFFKVILYKRRKNEKYQMEAYVLKNEAIDENVPLQAFMVPKDAIERASGLLLFHKLSDNDFVLLNGKCPRN